MIEDIRGNMINFEPYVSCLRELASPASFLGTFEQYGQKVDVALDGQPAQQLRKTVSLSTRREFGAFFTGHKLAAELVSPYQNILKKGIRVFDPACGAGDLLIACAKFLPIGSTLNQTLSLWGNFLVGRDIHEQFVRATKLRLLLLAQKRCKFKGKLSVSFERVFPGIITGDFFDFNISGESFELIVINPPYTKEISPAGCEWASGSITIAGCFIEKCVKESKIGTRIAAILPDVLRAGTRYVKWRSLIAQNVKQLAIKIVGPFDALTDVDVFRLHMIKGECSPKLKWPLHRKARRTLGQVAAVKVGTVVPFRDQEQGMRQLFIEPGNVEPWKEFVPREGFRRYDKTVFTPPFVVVRRTSGPCNKIRTVASIIKGKNKIAVENHLLVLKPETGGLDTCRKMLRVLKAPRTSKWLNIKIRCRHLTVSAVASIPWSED